MTKLISILHTAMTTRTTALPKLAASVAAGVLVLSGCSEGTTTGAGSEATAPSRVESSVASPSSSASESSAQSATAKPTGPGKEVYKGVQVSGVKDQTPTIKLTDDFGKVAVLHQIDLYRGAGEPVLDGSTVTVNYVGMGGESKEVFDSSFARGEPATFSLSQVIEGWSEGLIGMQPGGRRVLIIPGDMAYGSMGNPPSIGPDETLVFVVDLLETSSANPTAG